MQYDGIDVIGERTLQTISGANNFNKWMYETIKPYCKGDILEIGSGVGNISKFFLHDQANITLTDLRQNYCDLLVKEFSGFSNLNQVIKINLTNSNFDQEYGHLLTSFDTIFALNVVEHIEDHKLAIDNCYKLLKPGGVVIILVPAYQFLYNQFDKNLEHFRRYTKKSLESLIAGASFKIVHSQYFNLVAIAGWFINGSLLNKETIPEDQMDLFDKLVPFFKLVDKLVINRAGISTICVGRK
jgi:2-polyprenyl-3-methyl-5-hydroxy-6-metoxy-1,4-benzoquinol methylase